MNTKALIPVIAALIGFATGWTTHRAPEPAPAADATQPPASPKTRSANSSAPFREHHANSGIPVADPGESASVMESPVDPAPYVKIFAAAASRRDKARADRMAEALGLDETQRRRLDEILAEHKNGEGGPPPRTAREIIDHLAKASAALDDEISQILSPEQQKAYEAMKSRQASNQVESRVQRELAQIGERIDISATQREAILQALRNHSTASQPPVGASLLLDQSAPNAGQYTDMLADVAADNPDLDLVADPLALNRQMVRLQNGQIADKLSLMAPILTPAQLAQYRATLEADASYLQSTAPPLPQK